MSDIITTLKENPLIAAANSQDLKLVSTSNVGSVLLMYAKLSELMSEEWKIYRDKKPLLIHMDLLEGLSSSREAISFIDTYVKPYGIVSTKSSILRAAKKKNIITIQRNFLIDTKSLENSITSIKENNPDAVEIMPGIVPSIVERIREYVDKPIILGGLISSKEEIINALNSGADGVSFGKKELWNITLCRREKYVKKVICFNYLCRLISYRMCRWVC